MSNPVPFAKGHALANDYIVLRSRDLASPLTPQAVRLLCHRHHGIGADGIAEIIDQNRSSSGDSAEVVIWNADGSRAEVSGNGLRIAAMNVAASAPEFMVDVLSAGEHYAVTRRDDGPVSIDLPAGAVGKLRTSVETPAGAVEVTEVNVGNPHLILEEARLGDLAWESVAASLATAAEWPAGNNVELIRVIDESTLSIRIHERGVGPTAASGTGACASATAAVALELVPGGLITVKMPGGDAQVQVETDTLQLSGPVVEICQGQISLAEFR